MAFAKTEAGRAEIRARALPLSRAARNLLLVIDASKPAGDWLGLVAGVGPDDLASLVAQGLLAPAGGATAAVPAVPAAPVANAVPLPTLDRAALYAYLSGDGPKLLGPLKGYAFALDVERCDSLEQLQALALQLVERVRAAKGEAAADAVRAALGLR
ncbi:MAG: hypothetical protein DI603_08705 [Roseateles depolymerans]|uniref:Proline-rich protein n=1 Tax=Roseateles depolymerans TaxID=76731 RepID=A0A2W5FKS2_9BURK|nr:MAG: hypothetical protein DI603_08705 [Roseateles depolymerans]